MQSNFKTLFESMIDNHQSIITDLPDEINWLELMQSIDDKYSNYLVKQCQNVCKFLKTGSDCRDKILNIFFYLLLDIEPNCSVQLFLLKKLNKENVYKLFTNLVESSIIGIEYLPSNAERILVNLSILFNHNLISKDFGFLSKLIAAIFRFHRIRRKNLDLYCHEDSTFSSTDLFGKFSFYFDNEFKLASLILNWMRKNVEKLNPDFECTLRAYYRSISLLLKQYFFTNTVLIQGCLVIINVWYLLYSNNELSVFHDNIEPLSLEFNSEFFMTLLSTFLMESFKSPALLTLNIGNLIKQMLTIDHCDSNFVYHLALLQFNWAKTIKFIVENHRAKLSSTIIEIVIRQDVNEMLNFSIQNWSHTNVDYIFSTASLSIQILRIISMSSWFESYLINQLYSKFCEFNHSDFRLFCIISDSIGIKEFGKIFQHLLRNEYSLLNSMEKLLSTVSISSYDNDTNDDDDDDDGNLFINLSIRNIDFVEYLSIRLKLFYPEHIDILCDEFLRLLQKSPYRQSQYFLKIILPKLFQHFPSSKMIVKQIFAHVFSDGNEQTLWTMRPDLILLLLQLNQKENLQIIDEKNAVQNFAEKFALQYINNNDDDLRLHTLRLLIESKMNKKDELNQIELNLIYRLFKNCDTIQRAYGRDQLIKLFRILFTRIARAITTQHKRNKTEFVGNNQIYYDFIQMICRYCFDNLHINRYFGSLLIYLQILHLLVDKLLVSTKPLLIMLQDSCITPVDRQSLMFMLQHSLQEIRTAAKDFIVSCYHLKLIAFTQNEINFLNKWSKTMLQSIQPRESQIGVILKQLTVSLDDNNGYSSHFDVIQTLIIELNQRIAVINVNITNSCTSPCYPLLLAIRTLLCNEIDLNKLKSDLQNDEQKLSSWKILFIQMIDSCMAACESIISIVCNDSPEGHLPAVENLENINFDFHDDHISELYMISQMLLINGWMTIKESVLIISHLVNSFPYHRSANETIISCVYIDKIIDFLYKNQLNLVHRGAFEQSSQGFNHLIASLLKNECKICRKKIESKIDEIKKRLQKREDDGMFPTYVSITRRSAGLPFIIQSIIAGDLNGVYCSTFIGTLVDILDTEKIDQNNQRQSWQIIHSLNILKSLIHDNRLSSVTAIWIEKLFKISILWFKRDTYNHCLHDSNSTNFVYSIQNSTSLLLCSLITKVFGVKRNRLDTSRKNRMSSLSFFQSYPSLYSFILRQLESPQICYDHSQLLFINPILIILSKLIISKSANNVYDANKFLPLIKNIIYECRDARLRRLAVHTYSRLLSSNSYSNVIIDLNEKLIENEIKTKKLNHLHGLAMLVAEISREFCLQTMNSNTESKDLSSSSLIKLYDNLMEIFKNQWIMNGLVLGILHQAHYRIFVCLKSKNESIVFKDHTVILEEKLVKLITNNNVQDDYSVNLIIDYLIHSFIDSTYQTFFSTLDMIVASKKTFEAKLTLWYWLNSRILLNDHDVKLDRLELNLLKFKLSNLDTIYIDNIEESIRIQKYLAKNFNHQIRLDQECIYSLIQNSIEIDKFFTVQNLNVFNNVELLILNEIFILIFIARRIGLFIDMNDIVKRLANSNVYSFLDLALEMDENDTLLLLIEQCIEDFDEPILNSSVWSKFVDNIENLAAKLENISDRLTAIYCIGSCVRKFPFSNLSTNQDSYDILVRISIQFIQLLQDNEKIIRNASVVQITKLATMFLNEMNQNMSPQKNCIRLFVQIMMTGTENQNRIQQTIRAIFQIALHFLANDNTLESCSSARLFDKTKMNIFIDEYSIWMDLIDELYLYCQQQQIIESKIHNITLEIFLKQSDDYICKQFEKIESELNHAKDLDDENTEFIYSDRSIRRKKFLQLFQRLI
ncbi:thyroid adenoma-associated protein homolog [Dermatophagoides farinae]|uniref:thyroid adenoma-associated protein homolog n=1 Tax=Dermatophagoides farinae TaxID=6954 RepID=UPI003F60F73B